jgi:chromosome segregation ATPase
MRPCLLLGLSCVVVLMVALTCFPLFVERYAEMPGEITGGGPTIGRNKGNMADGMGQDTKLEHPSNIASCRKQVSDLQKLLDRKTSQMNDQARRASEDASGAANQMSQMKNQEADLAQRQLETEKQNNRKMSEDYNKCRSELGDLKAKWMSVEPTIQQYRKCCEDERERVQKITVELQKLQGLYGELSGKYDRVKQRYSDIFLHRRGVRPNFD